MNAFLFSFFHWRQRQQAVMSYFTIEKHQIHDELILFPNISEELFSLHQILQRIIHF